jgi:LmbE family N-acetylglucosaminyl deacetylase
MIGVLAAAGAAGIVAGVGCLRLWRYRRWFRLPADRLDRLMGSEVCQVSEITLGPRGFEVPAGVCKSGQTVLLELTVKASLRGHCDDPYIEMRDGELIHRQYFERGATGRRYLNISPFYGPGNGAAPWRLSLRGTGLRWRKHASLLAYDPPSMEGASVLVIAPHPDDAEIAAFGLYADRRSWVVTVTAGEKSTANLPPDIPVTARAGWTARLRVIDSHTVPQFGQVPPDRRLNLAYPDGALEAMHREPSRAFSLVCEDSLSRSQLRSQNHRPEFRTENLGCTWNDLVEELRLLLELSQPDIVACPHPLIDSHSDHIFTTVALERAMSRVEGKRPVLFLYAVHHNGAPAYPFGPAESLVGLPPGRHGGWVADSIHSLPLKPEMRQSKYFAVEAMHAVRRYDDGAPKDALKLLKSMRREFLAYIAGMGVDPTSFLRRAPRPNEIYYVVRGEALPELIERIPNVRSSSP